MIGARIKRIRESRGILATELANEIGTTKQTIFKYESGIVTNIPIDKVELIASKLGVTPAYLIGWSAEETDSFRIDTLSKEKQELVQLCVGLTPAQVNMAIEIVKVIAQGSRAVTDITIGQKEETS